MTTILQCRQNLLAAPGANTAIETMVEVSACSARLSVGKSRSPPRARNTKKNRKVNTSPADIAITARVTLGMLSPH
jgi:hypothetical protein